MLTVKDKERQLVKKYYDLIAERYQESNEYIAITKGLLFSFILESAGYIPVKMCRYRIHDKTN